MDRYDVAVVGGGTAGVIAAVQAARAGARTLLVEKTGVLGGTMVTAAVNAPASFHAGGRQVIAGIGWELVRRTLEETGQPVPRAVDPEDMHRLHIVVDRAVLAALADEMVVDAGADLLFHAMPARAALEGDAWHLGLCTKTGLRDVVAGTLVDTTGDADVVGLAGFERERPDVLQPGTLIVHLAGYDAEALDYAALQEAFDAEVAAGRLEPSDTGWEEGSVAFLLRSYGGNRIHVVGVDGRTSEGRTEAELAGRRIMLRLYRFLRRQPGLEGLRIAFFAAECGIRETVVIRGRRRISIADYEGGRVWPDAVCYSFYPVDIHGPTRNIGRPLDPERIPTIPFGAMIPEGSRRLVVAGRPISGDRESHSSYRVEATCMATGQVAGAAAALAAETGCDVGDVPLDDLRTLLREHGAIVPETEGAA
jgi:hypothetical protein